MKKTVKVESKENLALIQQLNELENKWKSQEKSRRRSSSASDHSIITSFDNLLLFQQTSPRKLMSSLQHRKPCSSAVEEILIDRRDAITTGRFKGRQLFLASAAAAEEEEEEKSVLTHTYNGGSEICSDWIQEREAVMIMDYQGSGDDEHEYDHLSSDFSESCSLPEEKTMVVEEKAAAEVVAEKRGSGRRRVATAVVLIVLALVLYSISCNGNNVEEFILVPT